MNTTELVLKIRTEKKLRPVRDLNPEVMGGHGSEVMGSNPVRA